MHCPLCGGPLMKSWYICLNCHHPINHCRLLLNIWNIWNICGRQQHSSHIWHFSTRFHMLWSRDELNVLWIFTFTLLLFRHILLHSHFDFWHENKCTMLPPSVFSTSVIYCRPRALERCSSAAISALIAWGTHASYVGPAGKAQQPGGGW